MGPIQGLAAGLAAIAGRAEIAFVCSTDMPFLHPAFVRRVLRAAGGRERTWACRSPGVIRSRWPPRTARRWPRSPSAW